VFHAI